MADTHNDFSYEGAHQVHKRIGNTISGQQLLSDPEVGTEVLNMAEELEFHRTNSHLDPLTGLLNRRGMIAESSKVRSLLQRQKKFESFSVIVMDMIGLKQFNNDLGSEGADEILKGSALSIMGNLSRGSDFVGRWGGDEFVVLSFNNNEKQTRKSIDRVISAQDPRVHFNIGFKVFPSEVDINDAILESVDLIETVKKQQPHDETGRSTGTGVVVQLP